MHKVFTKSRRERVFSEHHKNIESPELLLVDTLPSKRKEVSRRKEIAALGSRLDNIESRLEKQSKEIEKIKERCRQ